MVDKNYFEPQKFSAGIIEKYKKSAKRNLDIAKSANEPEVAFHFAYMALLKIGIYHLAKEGYRTKSRPGHHQKILEHLSFLMHDENILILGDKMRKDRNLDLYGADAVPSKEELREYLEFLDRLYRKMSV